MAPAVRNEAKSSSLVRLLGPAEAAIERAHRGHIVRAEGHHSGARGDHQAIPISSSAAECGSSVAIRDGLDEGVEAAVGGVCGEQTVDQALAGEGEHLVARLLAAVRVRARRRRRCTRDAPRSRRRARRSPR